MSRTKRKKRPKMRLGAALADHKFKDGTVRDGTPQHVSSQCNHHGACHWCEGNRTYANKKRLNGGR